MEYVFKYMWSGHEELPLSPLLPHLPPPLHTCNTLSIISAQLFLFKVILTPSPFSAHCALHLVLRSRIHLPPSIPFSHLYFYWSCCSHELLLIIWGAWMHFSTGTREHTFALETKSFSYNSTVGLALLLFPQSYWICLEYPSWTCNWWLLHFIWSDSSSKPEVHRSTGILAHKGFFPPLW